MNLIFIGENNVFRADRIEMVTQNGSRIEVSLLSGATQVILCESTEAAEEIYNQFITDWENSV